jgi:hypothetical protein
MLRLPLVATLVVAAVVAAAWAFAEAGAQRKLASLQPLPARGDYRVTLDFAPERFHQVRLQDAGRVVEVRGRTVFLRDLAPRALHGVAREFWVESIERWDGS